MAKPDQPKSNDSSDLAYGAMAVAFLGIVFFSTHAKAIEHAWQNNCDLLFYAFWLLILYFIYRRLKSNFDETKNDRKSLLKLKALRDQARPQTQLRTFNPTGDVKPKNKIHSQMDAISVPPRPSNALTEIKIGTRLKDGHPVYLSDEKRTTHVQVLGATGRGKTESVILPWMVQDFGVKKNNVILIDGKGDPELAKRFRAYTETRDNECDITVFDPMSKDSAVINPLQWGTPLQISDRIISSFDFPDPYYKAVQSEGLLTVVSLLHANGIQITFKLVDRALRDMEYLSSLSEKSNDDRLKLKTRALLNLKDSERTSQFSGILSQLSPFVTGEIAELVNGRGDSMREVLSVSGVLSNRFHTEAAIVLIPTLIYPEAGRILGRMLLQEIAFSIGVRCSSSEANKFASVFLDEFSSYAYPGFEQILNKARSAKVALHLSHQSTGDLEAVSPEFAKIVNTNTNIKCLLGLNDPDTADFFARHMGTETLTKFTERVEERQSMFGSKDERTGSKSMRETESYKVHPNRLKNLSAGEGVIHVPGRPDAVTEEIQYFDLHSLGLLPKNGMEEN